MPWGYKLVLRLDGTPRMISNSCNTFSDVISQFSLWTPSVELQENTTVPRHRKKVQEVSRDQSWILRPCLDCSEVLEIMCPDVLAIMKARLATPSTRRVSCKSQETRRGPEIHR